MKHIIDNFKKYNNPTANELKAFITGLNLGKQNHRSTVSYFKEPEKIQGLTEKQIKTQTDGYNILIAVKNILDEINNSDDDQVGVETNVNNETDTIYINKYFMCMILTKGLGLGVNTFGHVKGLSIEEDEDKIYLYLNKK